MTISWLDKNEVEFFTDADKPVAESDVEFFIRKENQLKYINGVGSVMKNEHERMLERAVDVARALNKQGPMLRDHVYALNGWVDEFKTLFEQVENDTVDHYSLRNIETIERLINTAANDLQYVIDKINSCTHGLVPIKVALKLSDKELCDEIDGDEGPTGA